MDKFFVRYAMAVFELGSGTLISVIWSAHLNLKNLPAHHKAGRSDMKREHCLN
jgi:hypothetical protein